MKRVNVAELKGGEYLAKPVNFADNQILYYEGTCLYMNHIEKMISIGIESVYIHESPIITDKEKAVIKENITRDCCDKVRHIVEHYITIREGLEELQKNSLEIFDELLKKPEVIDYAADIKKKNVKLYEHCVTVAALSIITALGLNLTKAEIIDIGIGALLHDMGLRYLSFDYNDKSIDDFTKDTLFEYKKHTLYGFASVEKESWMSNESKKIILYHHERLNGEGYPFRQKIMSVGVKIAAVVDAFDDIMCGIGCKKGNVIDALEYIKEKREIEFDEHIVDTFLKFIAVYPVGVKVVTNNWDEAIVISQNEYYTDRPQIKLISDSNGRKYDDEILIDLSQNRSVYIMNVKEN